MTGPEPSAAPSPEDARPGPRAPLVWRVAAGLVLVVGVAARFATSSHLWLDEALSVNIARLPLGDIPAALRNDGSPPLYYVLLHGWMRVVGGGDVAVRALSGVVALATLPLAWLAGRRLGGRAGAWAALLVLAANPFAIRYATEARMYSLLPLLALGGYLAGQRVLASGPGTRARVAAGGLGLATGLLLLTHYWAFYLVMVAGAALAWKAVRGPAEGRRPARRALAAMGAGSLLFVPWLPSFLHQLANTGTPWGEPGRLRAPFDTITDFAGGYGDPGIPLGLLYAGLMGVAVFGRRGPGSTLLVGHRPEGPAGQVAGLAFGALVLGIAAGHLSDSAFAVRYAAVVFPFVVLLVGHGVAKLPAVGARRWALAVVAALGLWATWPNLVDDRTSAGLVAEVLRMEARPGDVVVYCPDQLGPSVSRLLPAGGALVQLTFPRANPPELVDWTDYAEVNRSASALGFARDVLARAGSRGQIYVVSAPGYRTFGSSCTRLVRHLEDARSDAVELVPVTSRHFERPGLVRVNAPGARVGFGT